MMYVYLNVNLNLINILSNWRYIFGYIMNPNVTQKTIIFYTYYNIIYSMISGLRVLLYILYIS